MKAKKPTPPTVTVKPGCKDGVAGYVVRVNGVAADVHTGEGGYRAAMRHRDSILAAWKYARQMAEVDK